MLGNYFGVMLDCSRNGVMKVEKVREFIDYLALFGYNSLQLYTEDTFEVEGEPYFGYMRGGYTQEELKEIDKYAKSKGIELIPCVQTLAHLNQIFKWEKYYDINDVNDILLVDEEKTYVFLENIFKTISKCFSSKHINIGMDEAHLLGAGKHISRFGYEKRYSILCRHLQRVCAIADKYGLKPMMWSDMFFRTVLNGGYYAKDVDIPQSVVENVPENVELVYWNYYDDNAEKYNDMFRHHKIFNRNIWFAGGAWSWLGFAPMNSFTMRTMKPAMEACRKNQIGNVMITMWGDNGKECSYFSLLPSLFFIKKIYDGETDIQKIKDDFKRLTGEDFDGMCSLDLPNLICGNKDKNYNPCKYVLYNDLFNGFLDTTLPEGGAEDYRKNAEMLKKVKNGSKYEYIFDVQVALCEALSIKYGLGIKLRKAYQSGNRDRLARDIQEIKMLEAKIETLYYNLKKLWFKENKPQGFDVQEMRFGGLLLRLRSCRERLEDYLVGDIKDIPELETNLMPYSDRGIALFSMYKWADCVTVNVL